MSNKEIKRRIKRIERHIDGKERMPTMDSVDELLSEKDYLKGLLKTEDKDENNISM